MMIRRPWPCQPEWWPGGKTTRYVTHTIQEGVEWGWEAEGGIKIFLNYKNYQNITQKVTNNPIVRDFSTNDYMIRRKKRGK